MFDSQPQSDDGILRCYKDGKQFQNHKFFQKYPNALRITIYYDEVEITNALGTKYRIYELGSFYFTVQNVPSNFNSNTNNIFIFNVAYTLDIKKYGFGKIY